MTAFVICVGSSLLSKTVDVTVPPDSERLTEQPGGNAGGSHWYTTGSSPPGL